MKFTIFTPTYNRAHLLRRPFASLVKQTYQDFEWLVVNDGSTDDSERVLSEMQKEAKFNIRVITQTNLGKHMAFNQGVLEARGELFVNLDSDDELLPAALEDMLKIWSSLDLAIQSQLVGVTGLCLDTKGVVVGSRFPKDNMIMSSSELYFRYGDLGEKLGFQRTDILRKFPFPESTGVKFVAEGAVWFEIAKKYKTLFVNEPFRLYRRDLSDSSALSVVRDFKDVARARIIFYRSILESDSKLVRLSYFRYFKAAASYFRCGFHMGSVSRPNIRSLQSTVILMLGAPVGAALFFYDQLRELKKK
jgi:glycosyltransferase involved in cell wall biosynthesis